MKDNKKQAIILSAVAVVTLIILVIGATYAYFTAQGGDATSTNLNVTTYTTDVLTFTTGDAINIYADQSSFASGKGNATDNTFAKASLTANNKTNTATEHYYVYLNIENNMFEYTINESTPELILTVSDNNGNEITDIPGLTHTSVTDGSGSTITGYDITTSSGVLTLFNNREITANPSKEEQWNIKLTFVNYDKDQSKNTGKGLNAKVIIQKEEMKNPTLADYVISQYNGVQGNNNIYHHDSNLTNGANDDSYRYAGASGSVNNFVCFDTTASPCPTDSLYRIIGVFGDQVKLIKYDYANSDLLETDGDYYGKYSYGSSNYKGSNYANVAAYYWNNSTKKNTWSESNLNKVNLNQNFITNIGEEWAKKIATTTWKVGGNTSAKIYQSSMYIAYQNEITNAVTTNTTDGAKEYSAQIGLMYVSDYGYAASPTYWTYYGYNSDSTKDYRAAKVSNWMYMGLYEWTISRYADYSHSAFIAGYDGSVGGYRVSSGVGVRPSFYLESSVTYASGTGTQNNPIRIS